MNMNLANRYEKKYGRIYDVVFFANDNLDYSIYILII